MARKKTAKTAKTKKKTKKKTPARPSRRASLAKSQSEDVFDLEHVRQLVELMKEHDLAEVDLSQADRRIKLRRGDENPTTVVAAPSVAAAAAPPPVAPAAAPPTAEEDDKNIVVIKSPMVGTFYTKPNPEAETYVKVGDHVSAETTVCIIEAMKVFNQIPAECTGQVVAVLVENEQPVDVDKPLFKVDTSK